MNVNNVRAPHVMGITGTNPTKGSTAEPITMFSTISTIGSVAAALAVLPVGDDAPRVIRQFTSVFLMSSHGELWRVYEADTPDALDRHMPWRGSQQQFRVFIGLAHDSPVRVHAFQPGDSRDTDPLTLQDQLDHSLAA